MGSKKRRKPKAEPAEPISENATSGNAMFWEEFWKGERTKSMWLRIFNNI